VTSWVRRYPRNGDRSGEKIGKKSQFPFAGGRDEAVIARWLAAQDGEVAGAGAAMVK